MKHVVFFSVTMAALAAILTACDRDSDPSHDFGDNDPNVVVALGDSITAGYPGGLVPYPAILSTMIGKRVINGGVSGNTAEQAAARAGGLMRRYRPGYLLILVGSNDAIIGVPREETVDHIRGVIALARARKTIPIVGTVPPMFRSHAIFDGRARALNEAIRAMASQEGVKVADVAGMLNSETYFLPDGLHPNQTGHEQLAKAFANAF